MKPIFLKLWGLILWLNFSLSFAQKTPDGHYFNNLSSEGLILDGYDPVAFFTEKKPVKGSSQFQSKFEEATYYFASAENKAKFESEPKKYQPQFGGWCAYAVSLGRIAPIEVNNWSIVEGKLVFQHNARAVAGWEKNPVGNLHLAEHYWAKVASNKGKQIKTDEEKAFLVNTDKEGIGIQGYDPVAYFTENKAVKGKDTFFARYHGVTYWFASEENQNAFKDNSEKYAPQYGGFCAYAVSLNKLRPVNPEIFQIEDGRLMLQHTQDAYNQFNKDKSNNIKKADNNWLPLVKKRAGKPIKYDTPAKPAN
jgi:YHS domain-containing protein